MGTQWLLPLLLKGPLLSDLSYIKNGKNHKQIKNTKIKDKQVKSHIGIKSVNLGRRARLQQDLYLRI